MGTLLNSEDPHCFLRQNQSSEKEIITCDTSIYTMGHPDFIACSFMENSIGLKRVNSLGSSYFMKSFHIVIGGVHRNDISLPFLY